jgi:hypothetical protein
MTPEVKEAMQRLSQIQASKEAPGYAEAVMAVYGFLPEFQLYRDVEVLRDYLKTLED